MLKLPSIKFPGYFNINSYNETVIKYKLYFITSLLLLLLLIITYIVFNDFCNLIDKKCFLFLNKNLLANNFSHKIWGLLSHKNESWINVIIMITINIISIFILPEAAQSNFNNSNNTGYKYIFTTANKYLDKIKRNFALILYCWLSFQIILLVNNVVFQKILQIHRYSPSILVLNTIRLSETLNNINIKDCSYNSFPAGHALVLIYWALFINLYSVKFIKYLSIFIGVLLTLPRMISGAHWFSDTLFSLCLGWMYFNLSMWLAGNYEQVRKNLY